MTPLSKNFTLEEFYHSDTAQRLGISNVPGKNEIQFLTELVTTILQPLRDYYNIPITIRSGYRSAPLNRAVGGANNSQHMKGQAADITIHGVANDLIYTYIRENLPFDQLILEHVPASNPYLGWVHVSTAPVLRRDAISCVAAGDYREGLKYAEVG